MDKRSTNRILYFASSALIILILIEITSALILSLIDSNWQKFNWIPVNELNLTTRRQISHMLSEKDSSGYFTIDSQLGWKIKNNYKSAMYNSTPLGSRINPAQNNTNHNLTIGTFGDSYTHGDDVTDNATWQYFLQKQDDRFNVYNFGVSGYGIDQSYLNYRYRKKQLHLDLVLICFMSKDIFDVVNRFRPFHLPNTGLSFAKPRFLIRSDGQSLHYLAPELGSESDYHSLLKDPKAVFKRLGKNDFYYQNNYHAGALDFLASVRLFKTIGQVYIRNYQKYGILENGYYAKTHEAFQLSEKILVDFFHEVEESGSKGIVVFLPNKEDIVRFQNNETLSYQPLVEKLKMKHIPVIDTVGAFENEIPKEMNTGHYTQKGNQALANKLNSSLTAFGF